MRSDVAMKADEEKACWDERFDELFEDPKRLKHNTALERDQE